jgi:hypothetical protein
MVNLKNYNVLLKLFVTFLTQKPNVFSSRQGQTDIEFTQYCLIHKKQNQTTEIKNLKKALSKRNKNHLKKN